VSACVAFFVASVLPAFAEDEPQVPETLSDLTDEQLEEAKSFALGNTIFFLFHESGHMLVSEFDLPVLGKEEDAVDACLP